MRTTQPNLPFYGLDVAAKFPLLTRELYRQTYGIDPRPFDYTRPIKRWSDAEAGKVEPDELMIYDVATRVNGGFTADKDGFVSTNRMGMTAADAYTVNIPGDLGTTPGTTTLTEIRMPIELLSNERLQQAPFGGALRVKRLDVPDAPAPAVDGSFTQTDRTALYTVLNWVNAQKARG